MSDHRSATDQEGRPLLRAFGRRLNELIATLYPDERKRPGYARLAREIRETTGGAISGTYLWELATGKKRNVTLEQLDVLAEYFGVPPEYFLSEDVAERVNSQLRLAIALRDSRVRNLALRAEGLSPAALDAVLTIVEEARKVQNLEPVAGDSGDGNGGGGDGPGTPSAASS
ncbi:helix-turn-helix domain-containing protein [Streptomyces pulveraceus]|uniref:HTH cro/C1-type domain-containing protein n=1 Tax=Streptomyces pulveraceus TaxID=68258 RepID=A0ABW1GZ03_9ACTN